MNRLLMVAAAGFMALVLTACGDKDESKPADTSTTVTVPADGTSTTTTTTAPADDAAKTDGESH